MNEAAQGLLDPSLRLGLDLEGIGGRMAHAWGTLLGYVQTGSPARIMSASAGCSGKIWTLIPRLVRVSTP